MTEESGFDSEQGQEIFLFSSVVGLALGLTVSPVQLISWDVSLGIK
jgi:hypothetical protein